MQPIYPRSMIQSMTGFGKSVVELPEKKVTIEIRSLNSKNLDLITRIPSFYRVKELEIRNLISEKLQRGKVDFILSCELTAVARCQKINAELIRAYIQDFKAITPEVSEAELLPTILRLPDVLHTPQEDLEAEEWNNILVGINEALDSLIQFRLDEGTVLAQELQLHIENILSLLLGIEPFEDERIAAVRERMMKRLEEFSVDVDHNRLEQEIVFYLERLDVTEEKVRLKNHCEYFLTELNQNQSNGKKLGFITQEIGREINTLGSKSNHSEMQKIVVQMKDELEKIKEQSLNIL